MGVCFYDHTKFRPVKFPPLSNSLKWPWRSWSWSLSNPRRTSQLWCRTFLQEHIVFKMFGFHLDMILTLRSRSRSYSDVKFLPLSNCGVKKGAFHLKILTWPWNDLDGHGNGHGQGHCWMPPSKPYNFCLKLFLLGCVVFEIFGVGN